jgi:putative ABC transport system ATP-binding protein
MRRSELPSSNGVRPVDELAPFSDLLPRVPRKRRTTTSPPEPAAPSEAPSTTSHEVQVEWIVEAEPVVYDQFGETLNNAAPHDAVNNGRVAGTPAMTTALRMVDVVKEYPGDPPVRALDGVSLTISHGELAALVGPSGSGKSTLLHVVGTLDRPSEGVVEIDGHDTSMMSDRQLSALRARAIGFVFQQFFLLDGMTAVDNVAEGLLYTGASRRERKLRAVAALEKVGLSHRLTHVPAHLSGGEKQRVAIARALVGDPAIVLADEPTGALDTKNSASILELLFELNRSGSTIVVITHDRELADALPRQISFRDGRVESDSGLTDRHLASVGGDWR